ncbi:hypothetical protein PENSUB_13722 [Penicillium subrubescens]|uniref:Uncharacterized protein n=1 Tax=Penicillium subrubescens TaxID=1316194 RepID=A0A1Q5SP01_9EURO|nr:hypothetical protein PENSUB_13722 [Penicillium subrubescens]
MTSVAGILLVTVEEIAELAAAINAYCKANVSRDRGYSTEDRVTDKELVPTTRARIRGRVQLRHPRPLSQELARRGKSADRLKKATYSQEQTIGNEADDSSRNARKTTAAVWEYVKRPKKRQNSKTHDCLKIDMDMDFE